MLFRAGNNHGIKSEEKSRQGRSDRPEKDSTAHLFVGASYGRVNRRTGNCFYIHYLLFTILTASGKPHSFKIFPAAVLAGKCVCGLVLAGLTSIADLSDRRLPEEEQ
jgi:hypothetical protein